MNNGIYFTENEKIIDKIIECLPNDEKIFSSFILEPSCGEGSIIIGILKKAYTISQNPFLIEKFIDENIFFIDINPHFIEKTKENIICFYYKCFNKKYNGNFNSLCCDFTIKDKKVLYDKFYFR